MADWKDFLPIRMVRGFLKGASDGSIGHRDTNLHWPDEGVWLNNPEQKSAAGRFLSEWSGFLGGSEKGEKIGKGARESCDCSGPHPDEHNYDGVLGHAQWFHSHDQQQLVE